MFETVEDVLEHFGVRGMKWGIRKEKTPAQELAKVRRKLDRIDSEEALAGYGLRGWGAKKINKRLAKKDPSFGSRKMSPAEIRAHNKKASSRVIRSITLRGAGEVAVILAGGNLALNRVKGSPQTIAGGRVSVALLAANVGRQRFSQIKAVRTANKLDDLREQRRQLERQINGR